MTKEEFTKLLQESGLRAEEIAKTFVLDLNVVNRWMNGKSLPYEASRDAIGNRIKCIVRDKK